MPATFSLSLTNPTVTTPPENVVYSGLSGGNTLDLAIGNNFGYPMTIGGNSTGQFLAVLISDNILDATAAAALGVQAPWSIHSIVPPLSGGGSYTFNLAPPTGGIIIPNLGSITLELSNLLPTAKGIAQVQVQYQFDDQGDGLNLSASLSVIGAVNPDLAQLIGDDAPLRFSYYVNTGDSANPVMVSASPVTAENAVENLLQLNLLFQETMRAIFRLDSDNGNLVNAWDPGNPPVFRIFFPYFSVNEKLPAALDLTDSLSQADPSYNAITSAWNIAAALDPDNAKITQNGFWQIGLDPYSPAPAWIVQPLAANPYLFTATAGSATQPGPFLNLFFSHIFSGLPIDPDNPNTILYFQWLNFPGFNDGVAEFTLRKLDLAITGFTCTVVRSYTDVHLSMTWTAANAAFCTLTGDPTHLDTVLDSSNPYQRLVNIDQPLQSFYTLTAVGMDGVTQVTRTVNIQWLPNTAIQSPPITAVGFIQITPDGEKLLFADANNIQFFSPATLQPLSIGPLAPQAENFVVTPDSQTVFFSGGNGKAGGINLQSQQATPGSGYDFAGGSSGPFMIIALSADNSQLILGTDQSSTDSQTMGNDELVVLEVNNLSPIAASPVALPNPPLQVVVGQQTGNIYVALADSILVLDGVTFQPLSLPPIPLVLPFLMAIAQDEVFLYTVSAISLSPVPASYILSKIDAQTMQVVSQLNIDYGSFLFTELLAYFPFASLAVSPDNTILFISGMTIESMLKIYTNNNDPDISIQAVFNALDANTLQALRWSPLQSGDIIPFDMTVSPDGSQLITLASLHPFSQTPTTSFFAFEPSFQ